MNVLRESTIGDVFSPLGSRIRVCSCTSHAMLSVDETRSRVNAKDRQEQEHEHKPDSGIRNQEAASKDHHAAKQEAGNSNARRRSSKPDARCGEQKKERNIVETPQRQFLEQDRGQHQWRCQSCRWGDVPVEMHNTYDILETATDVHRSSQKRCLGVTTQHCHWRRSVSLRNSEGTQDGEGLSLSVDLQVCGDSCVETRTVPSGRQSQHIDRVVDVLVTKQSKGRREQSTCPRGVVDLVRHSDRFPPCKIQQVQFSNRVFDMLGPCGVRREGG